MSFGDKPLGAIYIKATPAMICGILNLPLEYTPAGLGYDPDRGVLTVLVENDHLPRVGAEEALPTIQPIYRREMINGVEQAVLERVEVEDVTMRRSRANVATDVGRTVDVEVDECPND